MTHTHTYQFAPYISIKIPNIFIPVSFTYTDKTVHYLTETVHYKAKTVLCVFKLNKIGKVKDN